MTDTPTTPALRSNIMEYTTRNLTADESAKLVRGLHLALGKTHLVDAALRVIVDQGLGIFAATAADDQN
jgi:hypothetical protein